METEYRPELPSDRLVRRWSRTALYVPALGVLAAAVVRFVDGKPADAAAGALLALVCVVIARLIWPR